MDEDAIGPKILWKIGEGLGFFGTPAHCSNERLSFLLAEGNCLPLFVIIQSPFSLVQQPSTSSMGCASFATCVSYQYTSSTAQGGGGSFKNRKRIGGIDCCE